MLTPDMTLSLVGWFALAGAALLGAAVSALSGNRRYRTRGLLCVVLAVTGLLMLLGVDLAALAWLGVGVVFVRLPAAFGKAIDRTQPTSANPPSRSTRLLRFIAGLPVVLLGVLLVNVVWSVDWQALPPPPPTGGSAEAGGRLLTLDLSLLLGIGLLLVAILVAARWILVPSHSSHEREGS